MSYTIRKRSTRCKIQNFQTPLCLFLKLETILVGIVIKFAFKIEVTKFQSADPADLSVSPSKAKVGTIDVDVWGHIISPVWVRRNADKVAAFTHLPMPTEQRYATPQPLGGFGLLTQVPLQAGNDTPVNHRPPQTLGPVHFHGGDQDNSARNPHGAG